MTPLVMAETSEKNPRKRCEIPICDEGSCEKIYHAGTKRFADSRRYRR